MKHFRFLYTLVFLAFSGIASSNTNQALLDSAANYYTSGKFEQAIKSYEQILNNGFESVDVYYNLGNAYFKSNKFPWAILNYERASKLAPNDEDIIFNLQLANTFVVDKIEIIPEFFLNTWANSFNMFFSSNEWALLSLLTFISGLALFLIFFLSGKVLARKISFWLGAVLIIGSLWTFNISRKQKWMIQNEPNAIVITPSVVVKSAPSETGTELFLIHEGLKIKVIDNRGNWRQIKLSNGSKGWVKETDFVII
jgi:tetratricopeptide (TPR) repeat protein